MPRVKLSPKRAIACKPTNIGHIIIFCESSSEEEYFNYFAQILEKNKYDFIRQNITTMMF